MNTKCQNKRQKPILDENWIMFLLFCWAALFFGGIIGIIIAIIIMLAVLWKIKS
ncbi:hypothetical protein [Anaerosacchariphilus polymeriproducens]|uniref:hypothetical protein n=1 Tax=Anaerosacchariphilus polymeriproducens TaxID=1812858 RepID=UPI0012D85286|nr:hypothetical protein [Anaerosacchariphilus polymeriproducens]